MQQCAAVFLNTIVINYGMLHYTPQNICLLSYDIININSFWAGRGLETETQFEKQVTWKD